MYTKDEIREEINRLGGPDGENAWFNLIEMPNSVLPELMDVCRSETDAVRRAVLVEIIWQHRQPDSLDFLGEALQDPNEKVWMQALDGLVAIGGKKALLIVEQAIAQTQSLGHKSEDYLEWLTEARDQISNGQFGESAGDESPLSIKP